MKEITTKHGAGVITEENGIIWLAPTSLVFSWQEAIDYAKKKGLRLPEFQEIKLCPYKNIEYWTSDEALYDKQRAYMSSPYGFNNTFKEFCFQVILVLDENAQFTDKFIDKLEKSE